MQPGRREWQVEGLGAFIERTVNRRGDSMKQDALARLSGESQQTISNVKTDACYLSAEVALALAPHLGVRCEDLRLSCVISHLRYRLEVLDRFNDTDREAFEAIKSFARIPMQHEAILRYQDAIHARELKRIEKEKRATAKLLCDALPHRRNAIELQLSLQLAVMGRMIVFMLETSTMLIRLFHDVT